MPAEKPAKGTVVLGDVPTLGRAFADTTTQEKLAAAPQAGHLAFNAPATPATSERFAGGYAFKAPVTEEQNANEIQGQLAWNATPKLRGFYDDSEQIASGARKEVQQNFYSLGVVGYTQVPKLDSEGEGLASADAKERELLGRSQAAPQPEAAGRPDKGIYLPEKLRQGNELAYGGYAAPGKTHSMTAGKPAVGDITLTGISSLSGTKSLLNTNLPEVDNGRAGLKQEIASARGNLPHQTLRLSRAGEEDLAKKTASPAVPPPTPQPEMQTRENAFSTFSLNVSDVSFKLAAASLEKNVLPDAASIRSEEFINAFDYRDPEPAAGAPIAFAWERARYPFAQNRDLLRFAVKTAAQGRPPGRALNLVLLLDNSGSMERADRVQIINQAFRVLAAQLQPQDKLSVVTFARTAQLWLDGMAGDQAGKVADEVSKLTPQGGTNLGEAMNLAYATVLRHYLPNGINRVVLLTDGAANLGDVEPESLKSKVEMHRKQGVAFDCFGIGWEGYNDDLLELLSRNGDGRYGFINSPEEAATEFAGQLAGALNVAASDVKVQVEFNPARVAAYRQIGYARHQLTKQQFRDNTVDAAEIAAAESGNALYVVEVNPRGQGALGTARVRYKVPGTADYREHEFVLPYRGEAVALEQASPAMRLAATASAFSEWLAASPFAGEVTPDRLLGLLTGVPDTYGADPRPKELEWMIRQAKSISGK